MEQSKEEGKKIGNCFVNIESIELFEKYFIVNCIYKVRGKSSQGTLF